MYSVSAWRRVDAAILSAFAAASLAVSFASIVRRPDIWRSAEFLFHDAGNNLLVADGSAALSYLTPQSAPAPTGTNVNAGA